MAAKQSDAVVRQQALVFERRVEGPLPPPDFARQYNEIVPDAAERLLRMAEKNNEARIALEAATNRRDFRLRLCGMAFSALVVALFVSAAITCVCMKQPVPACLFAGTSIAQVVRSLMRDRASPEK